MQAAREAARRSQCSNNMKQLGLALHNYHDMFNAFCPGGISQGWAVNAPGAGTTPAVSGTPDAHTKNLSGLVLLLPFLEQQPLYDQFDFRLPACDYRGLNPGGPLPGPVPTGNAFVVSQRVAAFRCPTDSGDPLLPASGSYAIIGAGGPQGMKTNYEFVGRGVDQYYYHNYWRMARSAAAATLPMFGENSEAKMRDVRDGTSNTAAMVERTYDVYNGECSAWGFRHYLSVTPDLRYRINRWDRQGSTYYPGLPGQLGDWYWAGSQHPGGCHILMADASVHFVSQTTDLVIMSAMQTMKGSESYANPF
ncbi:MAG: DUF1559 domain-containing protein [Rhodopirellula sp.]|nr:DUF1559 domain-containing protein [Rhodopirellula sp.]